MTSSSSPRLLALDTATEACSVALLQDGVVRHRYEELGRGHGERVLEMVRSLLDEHGLRLADLDALAVGRGPGGFTGVRLAVGVVQGLAFGAGLRVVGVSDLRAVAQQAFEREPAATHCLVCNDARMQEVYSASFLRDAAGLARPDPAAHGDAERVCAPDAVTVPPLPGLLVAGRGLRAYASLRERAVQAGARMLDDLLPSAEHIVRLAAADFAAGLAVAPAQLAPVYLRDRVAEPPSRS